MEQKEPSVLSPEGSLTFGGVQRENEGEEVVLPQMEDDLALCTSHPYTSLPRSYLMLISYNYILVDWHVSGHLLIWHNKQKSIAPT